MTRFVVAMALAVSAATAWGQAPAPGAAPATAAAGQTKGAKMNDESVCFEIPRLDQIAIDGTGADWGERGLHVDLLVTPAGHLRPLHDFDAHLRLGWDERGLLALVQVTDRTPIEHDIDLTLYQKDSIELFVAPQLGAPDSVQVAISPGIDAKFPQPRVQIFDHRSTTALKAITPTVEFARSKTADGYVLEVLLPWKNLGIEAQAGREIAFQLNVNDKFAPDREVYQVMWYPQAGAFGDTRLMQRFRLGTQAGPALQAALIGNYGNLDKTWLRVIGRSALAGKTVEVRHRGEAIAHAALTADGDFASAEFSLPMPPKGKAHGPITAWIDGQVQALLQLPNADDLRRQTFERAAIVFEPCVFTGTTLPPGRCADPELLRRAVGDFTLRVRYFDAHGAEVHSAEKEGRYGAVVEITAGEQSVKRYCTLMRWSDEWAGWAKESATWTEFLKRVGLDLEAARKQDPWLARSRDTDTPTKDMLARPTAPLVLAGLFEKSGGAFRFSRDVYGRDRAWWYGIKQALGDARNDYLLTLPPHFDAAAKEAKLWPLIVFLHGSGGGEGVLANFVKDRADFPFIILAPRSPQSQWIPEAVKADLDEVLAKYPVDRERIYLTGLSMGGFGTWDTVARYPDLFAAIAPVCGGGNPADAPLIRHVPAWIFHGVKDETVPVALAQEMFDALKQAGGEVKLSAYPDAGHDSWTLTYSNDALYQWFRQHRRQGDGVRGKDLPPSP